MCGQIEGGQEEGQHDKVAEGMRFLGAGQEFMHLRGRGRGMRLRMKDEVEGRDEACDLNMPSGILTSG